MRVCLIPLRIEVRNPSANLRHFQERLKEVAQYQPDVIGLPECAFTGYLYDEQDFQQFAESIPGQTTATISLLAKENCCYICFGMLEKAVEGVYDSAVLMDKAGEILLVHRKLVEQPPFINGEQVKTIETELGRLAVLVCGDLFHDAVKAKIDQPLNVLLLPMARSFDEKSPDLERWLNVERQAYMEEVKKVGCTTFLVNSLENAVSEGAFGGAMVVNSNGELLAESPHGTDEVLIFDCVSVTRNGG
ncbi:MAG: carbon-nitrogen hydrolase family protein [Caldilineaceae bacterium]